MMRTFVQFAAVALLVSGASLTLRADEAGIEFFERKIRPVLVEHCYECHSAEAKKLGGNLLLDHGAGLLKGGDEGPAIEPGEPDKSRLIAAVRYTDDALQMPPKGKLPAAAIADLEKWIKLGAPDPRLAPPTTKTSSSWEEILRTRRDWWSLRPVQKPAPPLMEGASGSLSPIDRFLLTRLNEKGIEPAGPADPRTLARRLSLILTGLPPNPEDVENLVRAFSPSPPHPLAPSSANEREKATELYVDKLLASPRFGERWARHWMDVVRFTETHGNEWNYEVHHAWRYRDYLVRAFNDDVPYDQFVREHIAGDLLREPRWNAHERWNESLIATGFYRFGEVNHDDCISLRQIGYDLADNQIDTLTKAFQATTVACARCHDHKLDAISADDYYALLGVLRSSRLVSHTIDAPEVNVIPLARLRELKTAIQVELAGLWLQDAEQLPRYLQAAEAKRAASADAAELARDLDPQRIDKWVAALSAEKQPLEDPLQPWRMLAAAAAPGEPADFGQRWRKVVEQYSAEDRQRNESNARDFVSFADFRQGDAAGWQVGGQGLREGFARGGEIVVNPEGDSLVKAILPAGCYTHLLSDKLNGTLRSPVLPPGKKNISFQVLGQRSSALRLVSNNCQLNYKNYKALTSADPQWVTFAPPDERESLRTYAELMTMFDNPKFPDQLSALGGDTANYKLPWEKAAENPRSFFGVTRVVLHDGAEPPKAELTHLRPLLAGDPPASLADLSGRYAAVVRAAVQAWSEGKATDDDANWLGDLVRRELFRNQVALSPRLAELSAEYRRIEAELSLPRVIAGIADGGAGIEQPAFIRGDCLRPGEPVPRRYLEVLSQSRAGFAAPGSGRLELAQQIASPQNPLTARVMVNRVWHHLFGTGLVRTVDDFGHVGELPSHPELLDHLAAEFVEEGWSVKRLIRTLVLTQAFQADNRPPAAAKEVDPENRLLSHYPARRMEAEALRDAILAASGRLDLTLFGMSVQPYREKEYADRRLFPGPLDGNGRRSIYIKNNLMESPKFLGAFNFPGGKVTQGRRDVTNVPAQALALLNDPLVLHQAGLWAERVVARPEEPIAARLDAMFRTALSRPPTAEEHARFSAAAAQLAELHQVPQGDVLKSQVVWKEIAHALFNLQEFIFIP